MLLIKHLTLAVFTLISCLAYSNEEEGFERPNRNCHSSFTERPVLTITQEKVIPIPPKKRPTLQLPHNMPQRQVLWEKIKSNPDKYADQLKLPKDPQLREKFFRDIEPVILTTPNALEIIPDIVYHQKGANYQPILKGLTVQFTRQALPNPNKETTIHPETHSAPHQPVQTKPLTEDQILEIALKLDSKILATFEKIDRAKQTVKQMDKLENITLNLHQILKEILNLDMTSENVWENYKKRVEDAKKELDNLITQEQIKTFQELLERPELVLADHIYSVNFPNGDYYIQFNKKVIDSLNKLQDKQIKHILETIVKGFVGGTRQTGLRVLHQNSSSKSKYKNNLLEVKTMGSMTGHIRIGGFKKGNHIHLVQIISESDHSKGTLKNKLKGTIHQLYLKNKRSKL